MAEAAVVMGANILCSFGLSPSSLVVIPEGPPVLTEGKPQATVMDHLPIANIPPFGLCTTLSNPAVAAATAAALGVLTPMPCVPVTEQPWVPGDPSVLVNDSPALVIGSECVCQWGGTVTIAFCGTTRTTM